MMSLKNLAACSLIVAGMASSACAAEGYGTIKGKFVVTGQDPTLKPVVAKGDNVVNAQVCAANNIPDQSLVVDPSTKAVANVFIWCPRPDGEISPSLAKPASDTVTIDNQGCMFVPHAIVVRTDQKLLLKNNDPVAHNVHTFPLRGTPINVLIGPNNQEGIPSEIDKPEILPIPVKCDIHPWMQSYALILDNPYAAVSSLTGEFEIKDVPVGKQTFRTWHEGAGYLERSLNVTVKAGETTDLGTIEIPIAKLTK